MTRSPSSVHVVSSLICGEATSGGKKCSVGDVNDVAHKYKNIR